MWKSLRSTFPMRKRWDDQRIYDRAKENLLGLIVKGVLRREETPAFYLYRQRVGERLQTGIVAGVSIAEDEAGRIRRHELTRADKEMERTRHIDTVGAQTGPIFLTYRGREAIDRLAARVAAGPPEYDFTAAVTAWFTRFGLSAIRR